MTYPNIGVELINDVCKIHVLTFWLVSSGAGQRPALPGKDIFAI